MKNWIYTDIFRYEFEQKMEFVESVLVRMGAQPVNYYVTPRRSTENSVVINETPPRMLYRYKNTFVRVGELLFPDKPFLVIEKAKNIELVNQNRMERMEPIPYDWTRQRIMEETIKRLNDM